MTLPHAVCPRVCANSCHEDICFEFVVDRNFSGLYKYLACDHTADHLFVLEEVVRLSHCQSLQDLVPARFVLSARESCRQSVPDLLPPSMLSCLFVWRIFLKNAFDQWIRGGSQEVHKSNLLARFSASTIWC